MANGKVNGSPWTSTVPAQVNQGFPTSSNSPNAANSGAVRREGWSCSCRAAMSHIQANAIAWDATMPRFCTHLTVTACG